MVEDELGENFSYHIFMRVLVLGGTGFIGTHIVTRLVAGGHDVAVLRRCRSRKGLHQAVDIVVGDRNRLTDSTTQFRAFRPEVVVDVIAYTEAQAEELVTTFADIAKRAVVLSSSDVYRANDVFFRLVSGPVEPTPLTESSLLRERLYPYRGVPFPPINGFSWDDYDKILVERVVTGGRDLPATVLRLPMVYGPGALDMRKWRFWPYWKRMDDGRSAILLDQQTARWRACWGYVEDIAEAVRLAVENEGSAAKVYNVAEPDRLDFEGRLRELAATLGWPGRIVVIDEECPEPSLPRSLNLNQHLDVDASKIRHELGYRETVPRNEALARCVAWEREHIPTDVNPALFNYAAEDAILDRVRA